MKRPFHSKFFLPLACSNPHSEKMRSLGGKEKHHSWDIMGKRIFEEREGNH